MKLSWLSFLVVLVVVASGCGPKGWVRPDPAHEVHKTPYVERERHTGPPPTLQGLPMSKPPAPPGGSGPKGERPSPHHVWIPGYHRHRDQAWSWVDGGWWKPQGGKSWVQGRWVPGPGGVFYWEKGHWQ